ncbi:hypothetical protein OY671_004613 [Metschnikowia pulcherrima]|nr:hypothetical protein OY671_004613 [Metschnikowia pulcherrima]
MKLILIAILAALGETMAINGVGFESESGTINKRFQFPKEKKPWDSPSSAPSNAPSNKIDWNQAGGTRMLMPNVQVDGPNLDFEEGDDTRRVMPNVQVDGPNLDFIDEQSSKNDVGKEAGKSAGETGGHELNINREFGVPDTVADWMKILASAHKALPPLIKNMKLAQFWPLKNDFEEGVAEIRRMEGEKGPSSFYLQTIGREFGRADQMAREMCTKNPSVDSGCKSHYPKKN